MLSEQYFRYTKNVVMTRTINRVVKDDAGTIQWAEVQIARGKNDIKDTVRKCAVL